MSVSRLVGCLIAVFFASAIQASPSTDALARCLSDSTSGKDRKDMARWIYLAMSAHPEIGVFGKAGPKEVEDVQRNMGVLFTRLVAEQCAPQMNAVSQSEGMEGFKIAFENLGRLAMQELMSNQDVNVSLGGFTRYIDKEKVERAIKAR
ncbi:MAG TPA: hypothetical protein PLB97_10560 [Accumulibacter sp.]|nr:hypothetical protein [Accumulibacter sp.]